MPFAESPVAEPKPMRKIENSCFVARVKKTLLGIVSTRVSMPARAHIWAMASATFSSPT